MISEVDRQKKLAKNRVYRKANSEHCREYQREYRKRKPEAHVGYRLKKYYGMSLEGYNKLLVEQDFKCKICKRHRDEISTMLQVDHDHSTGKVRGLLCNLCNMGLGCWQDDASIMKEAINYLSCERVEF